MNRSFKTEFHNGNEDGKAIVTMAVRVDNGKKFHTLDAAGTKELYKALSLFKVQIDGFMEEVMQMNIDLDDKNTGHL